MFHLLELIKEVGVIPFDDRCADQVKSLRAYGLKVGTQDLKIGSIALTHDALLLSNNLKDFKRIPGLKVESWIA